MTNRAELRRLAEASEQAFANLCEHGGDEAAEAWHAAEEAYSVASGSSVVLALLDESDEWERLFKSAGNATKNAISDRDQLRAQVEALRIQVSTLTEWYSNALDVIREVSAAIHGVTYMDPPDGGDVSIPEQIRRMAKDAGRYRWLRIADWQSPETAPKDRMIMVDVGMPWAAVATWSEYAEKWVLAELEWSVCDGLADPGFVTEYERTIKGWMELPEVARG